MNVHNFVQAGEDGDRKRLQQYIDSGGDVNAVDSGGRTALMSACKGGYISVVQYLEAQGANVNAKDGLGRTALILACKAGNLEESQFLIDKGAEVNAKTNDGDTALAWACYHGHKDIVQYLTTHAAADVNVKNNSGESAIMLASDRGHFHIVKFLEDQGAEWVATRKDASKMIEYRKLMKGETTGPETDASSLGDTTDVYSYRNSQPSTISAEIKDLIDTKTLSEFTTYDVQSLLKHLNMKKYCKSVVDNGIDGRTLMTCQSVEEIKELGIDITVKARMLFDEVSILKSIVPMEESDDTIEKDSMSVPNSAVADSVVLVQEDVASVISGTFLSSITTGNMSSITNENTQKKRGVSALTIIGGETLQIQKPLEELTELEVHHLLESLNLNKYIEVFKQNEVDGRTLQNCRSKDDLKELGITMTAKARVLFNVIEKLRSLGLPVKHSNMRDTIPSKLTDDDDDDKSSLMTDGTKMIQYNRSAKGDDDETVVTTGQNGDVTRDIVSVKPKDMGDKTKSLEVDGIDVVVADNKSMRVESNSSSHALEYQIDLGGSKSNKNDWIPPKPADTEDDKGPYTTTITKESFRPPAIGDDDDVTNVENTTVKTKQSGDRREIFSIKPVEVKTELLQDDNKNMRMESNSSSYALEYRIDLASYFRLIDTTIDELSQEPINIDDDVCEFTLQGSGLEDNEIKVVVSFQANSGSMLELGNALIDADMMDKQDLSCKLMVDDFKNKMWFRCGKTDINEDELYELAIRLNDISDFEWFAMRDIVSKTCGLAVIVPDGHFKTKEQVEEFINNCSCEMYYSIWIRESSYETEDHRFYAEIPTDKMSSEFEGENSSSFVVKRSHSLSVKETLGAVGFTCGPYVDVDGNWGNYDVQSLWIFSKFKDLIPVHFPKDILGGKYVVIRAAQQLCSDSYDARTVGQPLFSGLKVEHRLRLENGQLVNTSQSLGPFIAVTKVDSGVTQKGYLTTTHGTKVKVKGCLTGDGEQLYCDTTVTDGSTLHYSWNDNDGWAIGIHESLPVATCSNLKYGDRVFVSIDNIEYTVGVDFCIAMDENATCTKVLHKEGDDMNEITGETKDLNEIIAMDEIAKENVGVIYKVGFKTGNTMANHIGTLALFNATKYESLGVFKKGLLLPSFFNTHFLLVHSPPTAKINYRNFMDYGDSGGLCYIETGDILKGVGICICRLGPSHFYLILPLALIEAVYKEKGYNVRWNAITDDANGNLGTKVDDDAN